MPLPIRRWQIVTGLRGTTAKRHAVGDAAHRLLLTETFSSIDSRLRSRRMAAYFGSRENLGTESYHHR